MFFTLFVAVLAAMLWALRSFYLNVGEGAIPHDPSTLELAIMAAVTMATYVWMQRLRAIRQRAAAAAIEFEPPPVTARYAEAMVEATAEAAFENAEHVA